MGTNGNELTLFFISVLGHHLDTVDSFNHENVKCTPKTTKNWQAFKDMKGNNWE